MPSVDWDGDGKDSLQKIIASVPHLVFVTEWLDHPFDFVFVKKSVFWKCKSLSTTKMQKEISIPWIFLEVYLIWSEWISWMLSDMLLLIQIITLGQWLLKTNSG